MVESTTREAVVLPKARLRRALLRNPLLVGRGLRGHVSLFPFCRSVVSFLIILSLFSFVFDLVFRSIASPVTNQRMVKVVVVDEAAAVLVVKAVVDVVEDVAELAPTDIARLAKRTIFILTSQTYQINHFAPLRDSDKKVHQSWGGDDGPTELKVEEAATADAATEGAGNAWGVEAAAADDAWGAPAATDDAWAVPAAAGGDDSTPAEGDKSDARKAREREQEEEDNTFTLDQYLAQKAEKEASALPKLETRKANEGADDSLWKDAIQIQKEDEGTYFAGKVCNLPRIVFFECRSLTLSQPKAAPKARTEKKEKVYLEIDARFERPDRGGRGRGGRGGDRSPRGGGRGRGGGGGGRGRANGGSQAISMDDPTAFPSLS